MNEAIKRTPIAFDKASALITGGTSGVGLETACQLAEAGVPRIAIVGRNQERGQAARDTVLARKPGVAVEFLQGDCNKPEHAVRVCEAARAAFGSVDILVNSTVSSYGPTLLHDIPVEEMQNIVLEQMMAPLLTSRIVLPWMAEKGGGAIVVAEAGHIGRIGQDEVHRAGAEGLHRLDAIGVDDEVAGGGCMCGHVSVLSGWGRRAFALIRRWAAPRRSDFGKRMFPRRQSGEGAARPAAAWLAVMGRGAGVGRPAAAGEDTALRPDDAPRRRLPFDGQAGGCVADKFTR